MVDASAFIKQLEKETEWCDEHILEIQNDIVDKSNPTKREEALLHHAEGMLSAYKSILDYAYIYFKDCEKIREKNNAHNEHMEV